MASEALPSVPQRPSSPAVPPPNDSPSCRYLGIGIAAILGLAGVAGVGIAMAHLGIPHHFWSTKLLSYIPKLSIPLTMSGGGVAIIVSIAGGFLVYKFARPPARPALAQPAAEAPLPRPSFGAPPPPPVAPVEENRPPVEAPPAPPAAPVEEKNEEQLSPFEAGLKTWIDKADGEQKKAREKAAKVMKECKSNKSTSLDLSDSHLTSLPPVIGQLTRLKWLYLYGNELTELPNEISQLRLTTLSLKGNPLSDTAKSLVQALKDKGAKIIGMENGGSQ